MPLVLVGGRRVVEIVFCMVSPVCLSFGRSMVSGEGDPEENGEYCVDIEAHGIYQRGDDTIPAVGTVVLPSRRGGSSPVEKRLPSKDYRGTGKGVFF